MRAMTGGDDLSRIIKNRIRRRLEALGLSATEASKRAGLNRGTVGQIIRPGKQVTVTMSTLERIATVLQCEVDYFYGRTETVLNGVEQVTVKGRIPVVGDVEAGVFREMIGPEPWLEEYQYETVDAPRSSIYPNARHFAFRVRGDSMNAAKKPILDGDIALFIDIVDAEIPITDGKIYLVRRTQDAGQTWEWTLKKARVYRDRIELVPESTNPIHKKSVFKLNGHTLENGTEVAAVGLLYGRFYSDEVS